MSRIFEPFFTTKDIGTRHRPRPGDRLWHRQTTRRLGGSEQRTSQRQHVRCVSFPPATKCRHPKKRKSTSTDHVANGKETVLIVEDEPVLRSMARDILEECGYRILEASSGKDALEVWHQRAKEIDLVLTDMVMPEGISGVDLAEQLLASRPGLKIVFTSGYTANEVNQEMLTRTGASFLSKPYTHAELAKTVRDCLDQSGGQWPWRMRKLMPHGNPRARRGHRRHFERHSSRRTRRTRPGRRL